jgi:hypothetical protein
MPSRILWLTLLAASAASSRYMKYDCPSLLLAASLSFECDLSLISILFQKKGDLTSKVSNLKNQANEWRCVKEKVRSIYERFLKL